jgi:DNA polymerase
VTKSRGVVLPWPASAWRPEDFPPIEGFAVATIHPSAVLRAEDRDEARAGLVADLKVVASAV